MRFVHKQLWITLTFKRIFIITTMMMVSMLVVERMRAKKCWKTFAVKGEKELSEPPPITFIHKERNGGVRQILWLLYVDIIML